MCAVVNKPVCILAKALRGLPADLEPDAPAVLMAEGRIKALGRAALEAQAVPWDMSRFYLTPAALDSHVHLWLSGDPQANLRAAYLAGIAAVRDLGHPRAKKRSPGGDKAPLVVSCGLGLGQSWLAERYEGEAAYIRAAEERIAQGVDFIKVFATGLLDFEHPGQVQEPLALSPAELKAVVKAAQGAGRTVSVHASGEPACQAALEAGVACIEHGYFMTRAQLEMMAQRSTAWAPTLAAVLAHADDLQCRHLGVVRENIREIANMQIQAMRQAEALGVELVLGTDAGSYGLPHGQAVYIEMAAWLEAGLRPQTVYQAATARAAEIMGLAGDLGAIKTGARAWLLATREDPLQNPLTMQSPAWRSF